MSNARDETDIYHEIESFTGHIDHELQTQMREMRDLQTQMESIHRVVDEMNRSIGTIADAQRRQQLPTPAGPPPATPVPGPKTPSLGPAGPPPATPLHRASLRPGSGLSLRPPGPPAATPLPRTPGPLLDALVLGPAQSRSARMSLTSEQAGLRSPSGIGSRPADYVGPIPFTEGTAAQAAAAAAAGAAGADATTAAAA